MNPLTRLWRDVSLRITSPIKAAFRDMEDHREIDMDNHRHIFVVGHVQFRVLVKYALAAFVPAFNARCIGGSGRIPELLRNHHAIPATPQDPLPSANELAEMYVNEGHSLTLPSISECEDVDSDVMDAIFNMESAYCIDAYTACVHEEFEEFSIIIKEIIAAVGLF